MTLVLLANVIEMTHTTCHLQDRELHRRPAPLAQGRNSVLQMVGPGRSLTTFTNLLPPPFPFDPLY